MGSFWVPRLWFVAPDSFQRSFDFRRPWLSGPAPTRCVSFGESLNNGLGSWFSLFVKKVSRFKAVSWNILFQEWNIFLNGRMFIHSFSFNQFLEKNSQIIFLSNFILKNLKELKFSCQTEINILCLLKLNTARKIYPLFKDIKFFHSYGITQNKEFKKIFILDAIFFDQVFSWDEFHAHFSHIFLNRVSLIIEAKVDHLGNTFFNRPKKHEDLFYLTYLHRGEIVVIQWIVAAWCSVKNWFVD